MSPPGEENTEIKNLAEDAGAYPCLEVVSGPKGGGHFVLQKGKMTIGRSRENDIVLDDSSVSRRHAVLDVAENGVTIADMGSRNGTKIGGQKIQQAVSLAHKTKIKIGVYVLRYLTSPAEPDDAPVEAEEVANQPSSPQIQSPPEQPPPKQPAEEAAGEGHFPPVPIGEESPQELLKDGDIIPLPPTGPKKSGKKIFLYGGLVLLLVVAAVLAAPQVKKFFAGKHEVKKTVPEKTEKIGQIGGVLPAETQPLASKTPQTQPIFLDLSSTPIPAQIFFSDQNMGITPVRTSTSLTYGKWYEIKAVFQLPEVGEVVEEKQQFSPPEGATVMPINFAGKIGIFKVAGLPRDAQLYLEGYFEKDPYRAKPIKFAEVVFGKPIYVPFGRYILELRKSRQLGNSQTYLDEVVYRREFNLNGDQTTYTVDVKDDDLKIFPMQLTSLPPAAKVFIDEKEVGTTPYNGTFPIGEHLLTMKRDGFFDFVQVVKMETNMPYVAEIQLKTSAAGELINKADGLMKESRFTEALPVLVEAFSKNPSPLETSQISYMVGLCYLKQKSYKEAQDYFLKAMQNDDYKYQGRLGIATVTFEQGDTMKALQLLVEVIVASDDPKVRADAGALFQRISPLKSVMYITSEPSGARVFVNGTEVSERTPLILHDLGVGSYRIQFRKDGYQDTEIKLNLGVSEFRPVIAKLNPQ